jgi:hypothetical protein
MIQFLDTILAATDQEPKRTGWGDMPSKPYKPQKWGDQPKVDDDDAPRWSSAKSSQHNGNGKAENEQSSSADTPKLKWSEYEDDDLPELPAPTNAETKDDYDPWAALPEEALPSTTPQSQRYEEIWGDNAVDSGGGAEWQTKGGAKSKRGRGRGSNNFGNGDRDRDGGRGGGDTGAAGKPWAPKSGPDSRSTTGNRGGGPGRGAKPMVENRHQRNGSLGNKGKQKAVEIDEEQQDSRAQRSRGNIGSPGRSSPGPAQAQRVPTAPPHVQGPEEGSSTGLGSAFAPSSGDAYDSTAHWGAAEPIAETTEDIYASFANAPPVETEVRRMSPSPGTPATPATPTTKKAATDLQEEFDRLYKEHCAAEKRRIEQLICPSHQIVCKKGVCKDIAKIIRTEQNKVDEKFKPRKSHCEHTHVCEY